MSLSDFFGLLRGLRNLNMLKVDYRRPIAFEFQLVDGERGGGVLKVYVSKFE